jgi:hypothetical protein
MPSIVLLLFALVPVVGGCTGLSKEHYYVAEGAGAAQDEVPAWEMAAPEVRLSSITGDVEIMVRGEDYAHYDWLTGPIVIWIVPLFIVSWAWYEPLPEDVVRLTVTARDPRDEEASVEIHADGVRLGLEDGRWLTPTYRRGALDFTLPDGVTPPFQLRIDGIEYRGVRQEFPAVTIERVSGWKVWAPG